jgi:hypothetical protein
LDRGVRVSTQNMENGGPMGKQLEGKEAMEKETNEERG